jgi:hypothetical protein
MANDKKIYFGQGKKKNDKWFKATFTEKNLRLMLENLEEHEGTKYVKVDINVYDTPDKYGKDVKITLDDWQPNGQPAYAPVSDEDANPIEQPAF